MVEREDGTRNAGKMVEMMKTEQKTPCKSLSKNLEIHSGPSVSMSAFGKRAFSLVELLTVIAIIGLLAAITMGVTGLASRKMKESRMKAELHLLMSQIEDYKSKLGDYPPDNPQSSVNNQLFYELSGTLFTRQGLFQTLNGQESLPNNLVQKYFNRDGFANSARERTEVKYTTDFRASQYKVMEPHAQFPMMVLAAPMKGPVPYGPNRDVNPWNYVSTRPTNNPNGGYDLWIDVVVGNQIYRYCNWSSEPIPLP
jgi:prepilin-type N-terminal cleavage/methylation domain-containing protein